MIDGESSLRPLDTASLALAKCEAEEPVGIIKIDVNDENPTAEALLYEQVESDPAALPIETIDLSTQQTLLLKHHA
ncbi:hypothetical protein V2G26_000234 [Clonostachys chloroleuca]